MPLGVAAQSGSYNSYDIALFGDMPYGTAREPAYERLIADVNDYHPRFGVHIGDTKSGSTLCEDSQAFKTLSYFNRFLMPVIYSVGEMNGPTACGRTTAPITRWDAWTCYARPFSLPTIAWETAS